MNELASRPALISHIEVFDTAAVNLQVPNEIFLPTAGSALSKPLTSKWPSGDKGVRKSRPSGAAFSPIRRTALHESCVCLTEGNSDGLWLCG